MKKGEVYYNDILAGFIELDETLFKFYYDSTYLVNDNLPQISLSFPKQTEPFLSNHLFPFFYGLLAEGEQKDIQCRTLKIDEDDHFTRLLKTTNNNTIGAVTVKEVING